MHLTGYLYEDYHDARSLEHNVVTGVARVGSGQQQFIKTYSGG
jgi:hypothetical protein